MKERILTGLFAGALGVLTLFFGITYTGFGANALLAIGIGGIILGLGLVGSCVVTFMRLDEKVPVLGKVAPTINLLAYPALLIIEVVVFMAFLGAGNIPPVTWALDLFALISASGLLVFGILVLFLDKPLFLRLRDLCLGCTLLALLLFLAFAQNGAVKGLGDISVYEFAALIFFGGIAFFAIKDSLLVAKEKITADRPVREPEEETVEETAVETEPEEPEEPEQPEEPEEPETPQEPETPEEPKPEEPKRKEPKKKKSKAEE